MKKRWDIEVSLTLARRIEADTYEEAIEIAKKQLLDGYPHEIDLEYCREVDEIGSKHE